MNSFAKSRQHTRPQLESQAAAMRADSGAVSFSEVDGFGVRRQAGLLDRFAQRRVRVARASDVLGGRA